MSVALMIEKIDGEELNKYIPVSIESFFLNYWLPVIKQMKLVWLPLMQPGFPITEEDLPDVLTDLRQLQEQLPNYYSPESDQFKYMNPPLTTLITELEALEGKKVELYLG